MMTSIAYDWVSADDLSDAIGIEQEGYPSDEAASIDAFRYRQTHAGNLFLGAYALNADRRRLIGYVCATLSPEKQLTHSSMSTHVPGAASVCIHSVCVDGLHRRSGVGLALMKEYIRRLEKACMEEGAPYESILLITHEELRKFYEKAGFEWLGKSEVQHGSKAWFEMRRRFRKASELETAFRNTIADLPRAQVSDQNASELQQRQLADVLEALQRGGRNRNTPRSHLFSGFANGIADVVIPDGQRAGTSVNKYDLMCPRQECGSIILKKGVGMWVERSSVQLEPPDSREHALLPALPEPPETTHWWLIAPSPMAFENVGFSRPIPSLCTAEPQMRLLTCAECELGPLGWNAGGTEFWLACSRVAYGA